MRVYANADVRTVVRYVRVLRSPYLIELDHHLAGLDVRVLGGKKPAYDFEGGDDACTVHCLAPFGFSFELVTYPHGRYRAADFAGAAGHPGHPG